MHINLYVDWPLNLPNIADHMVLYVYWPLIQPDSAALTWRT